MFSTASEQKSGLGRSEYVACLSSRIGVRSALVKARWESMNGIAFSESRKSRRWPSDIE